MELVPYYVLTIDEDSIASLKALIKNDPEVEHRPSIPQVADSEIAAKQVQGWKRESIGTGELQFNFPHNHVQNQCITVSTFENRPIIQPDPSAVNDLPPQIDLSERRYHNKDYMHLGHYRQKPYDRQDDLSATDPSIAALRRTRGNMDAPCNSIRLIPIEAAKTANFHKPGQISSIPRSTSHFMARNQQCSLQTKINIHNIF